MASLLRSNVCTQEQLESEPFRAWVARTREPFRLHRKQWEFAYIAQALHERGMLGPGRRGLGFGVGKEPLVAIFADRGCQIVATDLDVDRARRAGWVDTGQYMADLELLNERAICDSVVFRNQVFCRVVDMNAIPDDLRDFDFTWSSCSLEHLGSIEAGLRFLERQMDCLKPGGVAVHTTELNLSSDEETLDNNPFIVLFRRKDLRRLADRLSAQGHEISLDLSLGNRVADNYVDLPPYPGNSWEEGWQDGPNPYHLKLQWDRYTTTSVGLIVRKAKGGRVRRLLGRISPARSLRG